MTNRNESALDAIFEIRELMGQQNAKIDLLTQNLALISNKVNLTLFPTLNEMPKGKEIVVPKPPAPKPKKAAPPAPSIKQPFKPPVKNIKVYGHLQDDLGKNLIAVEVQIMDTKNRVIKKTKTNRAGTWMSFLPPGRYSVAFSLPGMMSDSRVFDLVKGQGEVEVS